MKRDFDNVSSYSDLLSHLKNSISSLNTESSTTKNSLCEDSAVDKSNNNVNNVKRDESNLNNKIRPT